MSNEKQPHEARAQVNEPTQAPGWSSVAPPTSLPPRPSFADYYGNAILGGLAMAFGALIALVGFSAVGESENFFQSTGGLLFLLVGVTMGGLGFVGIIANEVLKEIRKLRTGA